VRLSDGPAGLRWDPGLAPACPLPPAAAHSPEAAFSRRIWACPEVVGWRVSRLRGLRSAPSESGLPRVLELHRAAWNLTIEIQPYSKCSKRP
jgi:hypothetical protein